MNSTDMMLDVTSAAGLGEQTLIAVTLHLPDDMGGMPDRAGPDKAGPDKAGPDKAGPDKAGPDRLIFAIHGGGYHRGYWHPPFADDSYSFARWFTDHGKAVLAIDMLGMGHSTRPEPESQLSPAIIAAAHAEALRQVVARWRGPVGVTGVGHSMGGMMLIAQAAAHRAMDRVAVLGWANTPMQLGDSDVAALQAGLIPGGYLATPREAMRTLFYGPDVPEALIAADEAQGSTTPATLGRAALTPGIVHAAAARIAVPVLIVQSAIDTSPAPADEPGYFSAAPQVELQIVAGAAHCQNFAGTRAQHWAQLNDWIDRTS